MKLRHRLFLFSTVQLVVFGGLFAIAFFAFQQTVVPAFQSLLSDKSVGVARAISSQLDVSLGAEDQKLMENTVAAIEQDPDFEYLEVRNSANVTVFAHGTLPQHDLFVDREDIAVIGHEGIWAWKSVSLEGLRLGAVAVVFGTERVDRLETWARRFGIGVAVLWLFALAYSIMFARSFVSPIRAMMDFSRKVAGGELADRLTIKPPGELAELRDYLNQMTADLERREQNRKIAAAQTEEMQRELLSVSRMAGMAEVATGVLHNVGNVLNSLNISVSVIGDQVRNSRTAALSRSVDLYEGFPGGLSAFLETDKGKILPGYLRTVSRRLVDENLNVLSELASVTRNVDHIKSIVAMQQSYARPTGIDEPVALASVIDDALRMGESSFAKHGIEVVKDYADGASVMTDRHKLLQILINIIANSRHALKDHPEGPQRLTVTVRTGAAGTSIAISDTGIGIAPENLPKIFQHGFTTKKGGHGFGLHASANAAREIGGTLAVSSEGPGRGATFTLQLPSQQETTDVTN
jgi:signal transduction histidine kinase